MNEPTTRPDAEAEPFARALDELLRAWSNGDDPRPAELATRFPELGDAIESVFELAREIAVVRPMPLPAVPGYDVLAEIGRGGMGIVYRARQRGLDRIVALKVLPTGAADAHGRARFLAEARGLGRVRHDHVVAIHEVIDTADLCAYAMEWVDGRSFASLLEELASWPRRGPAPSAAFGGADSARLPDPAIPWLCRTGIAIAHALAAVHAHGLVHRDVKPSNVLLRADGTALLSDFGLVRAEELGLTRTGQVLGTPAFAAPEQLRGSTDVGPAADVFGLGTTLHCAFAGRVPFAGHTPLELLAAIEARRREPLTRLGLPKDLETIVARCLEPEPRDRYASAAAVAADIENLLALRPVTARPLGAIARTFRLLRRNRRAVAAASASAVLVLIACALLAWRVWDAITLPGRVELELRAARFALLEPTHDERVELGDLGRPIERESAFVQSGSMVLAAYASPLALDPSRTDIARERDVAALALALVRRQPLPISDELQHEAPQTCAAAEQWHEAGGNARPIADNLGALTATDRRLLGLLAYLTDHPKECHAAWASLELAGDPFIDAAAGQMHLQHGEPAVAYPRLALAAKEWPDAGFLAVSLADCAVRCGDLAVADRELQRAKDLGHKNPFDTDVRVRADLLAARGETEAACRQYEWLIQHHVASVGRAHYRALLERIGDLARLVDLAIAESGRTGDGGANLELAWRWWRSLTLLGRAREFAARFSSSPETSRLYRLTALLPTWRDSGESRTARSRADSLLLHEATTGLGNLVELIQMKNNTSLNLGCTTPRLSDAIARGLGLVTEPELLTHHSFRTAYRAIVSTCLVTAFAASLLAPTISAQSSAAWTQHTPTTAPSARYYHMSALDPITGEVLVCGGSSPSTAFSDMWAWDGLTWRLVGSTPGGTITAARMVNVDSLGAAMLFGGASGAGYINQNWLWDGASWTSVGSAATNPPARASFGMAYDSRRDRVVVHSGQAGTNVILNDTWEWNPATRTWRQVSTAGPALYDFGLAFDRARGVCVLAGGLKNSTTSPSLSSTVWTWDGVVWRQANGSVLARAFFAMDWDEARQRLVACGGSDSINYLTQPREWDGAAWIAPTTTSPQVPVGRGYVPIVFHPATQQMVMFGGALPTNPVTVSSQTWCLTTNATPRIDPTGDGCASTTTNLTPALSRQSGTGPWTGDTLTLRLDNLATTSQYLHFLAVDLTNPNQPLAPLSPPGCLQLVDLNYFVFPLLHGGFATLDLPIPGTAPLGLQFFAQGATLDPSGPFLIDAVSNGLRCTIGTR